MEKRRKKPKWEMSLRHDEFAMIYNPDTKIKYKLSWKNNSKFILVPVLETLRDEKLNELRISSRTNSSTS